MKIHLKIFTQACLLIGLVYLLSTCKDKKEPNPCAGAERVSAEFVMGRKIQYQINNGLLSTDIDTLAASDTVLTGMVYFEAIEQGEGVMYEWLVGNDQNTSTQRQFFLVFQETMVNVPVRLIVRRPNSTCFAEGTDTDTLVKYLTVIERDDNPIYGLYEGYLLSKPDEVFEVRIANDIDGDLSGIININKGCNPSLSDGGLTGEYFFGYKRLFFYIIAFSNYGCLTPNGWAWLGDDDSIHISFKQRLFSSWESPILEDVFIGTRKE